MAQDKLQDYARNNIRCLTGDIRQASQTGCHLVLINGITCTLDNEQINDAKLVLPNNDGTFTAIAGSNEIDRYIKMKKLSGGFVFAIRKAGQYNTVDIVNEHNVDAYLNDHREAGVEISQEIYSALMKAYPGEYSKNNNQTAITPILQLQGKIFPNSIEISAIESILSDRFNKRLIFNFQENFLAEFDLGTEEGRYAAIAYLNAVDVGYLQTRAGTLSENILTEISEVLGVEIRRLPLLGYSVNTNNTKENHATLCKIILMNKVAPKIQEENANEEEETKECPDAQVDEDVQAYKEEFHFSNNQVVKWVNFLRRNEGHNKNIEKFVLANGKPETFSEQKKRMAQGFTPVVHRSKSMNDAEIAEERELEMELIKNYNNKNVDVIGWWCQSRALELVPLLQDNEDANTLEPEQRKKPDFWGSLCCFWPKPTREIE